MGKLVTIKIVNGNFESGFSVIVQIGQEGKQHEVAVDGSLPPAPEFRGNASNFF